MQMSAIVVVTIIMGIKNEDPTGKVKKNQYNEKILFFLFLTPDI